MTRSIDVGDWGGAVSLEQSSNLYVQCELQLKQGGVLLFPLDGAWRFRRNVVGYPVNALNFVYNAV